MERAAVQVRRGHAGAIKEHAGGLVAGAYRHRTSRAGDPQLHTHTVAVNLAQGLDGRWTALHGAALYTHAKTGGYLYQAALRAELTRELGVEWGPVIKGAAEVVGVPRGVLEEFSQRRAEILARLAERGESSSNAARHAALDTRQAKEYGVDASTIYERWQARAAEHGLTREAIAEVLGRGDRERVGKVDRAQAALLMTGESGLTAQASTFGRREALQAWAQEHGHGGSVAQVEQLADRWLSSDLAVRVAGDRPPVRGDVIATKAGRRVAQVEDRFSTPSMLAAERAVLARAKRGMNTGAGVAAEAATAAAVARRPTLRAEQAAMVEQLTRSGHRVDAVRGLAGSGKTFALDGAGEAWRSSGLVVGGVTLSGKAADVLRDETGIATQTIAKFLLDVDRYGGLAHGQVLVVDEAGMVGTRDLARLIDLVERAEGKLVLVGDDHQLPEIDAGGAFRALVERQAGVQLEQVTRQRDPRAMAELAAIRAGRADEALASMAARGNLTMGSDAEQTRELMVRSWLDGHKKAGQRGPAFMVAKRNDDVRDLNRRAREVLLDRGALGEHEVQLGARAFREGDRVVVGQNDTRLGVRNGTAGTIERIDEHAQVLRVRSDRDKPIELPFDFAGATARSGRENLDHAYAVTVYRAQGDTWGSAYFLGAEDTFRQEAYTALSRPRHEARFFATVPVDVEQPPGHFALETGPLDELRPVIAALGRDGRKQLAVDVAAHGELHAARREELDAHARELRDRVGTIPAQAAIDVAGVTERLAEAYRRLDAARAEHTFRVNAAAVAARGAGRETAQTGAQAAGRALKARQGEHDKLALERQTVVERQGDPAAWARDLRGELAKLIAVDAELARRRDLDRQLRLQDVTLHPPNYITDAIGAAPENAARRGTWNRAAQHIERYRLNTDDDIPDRSPGLGPSPIERTAARQHRWHHDRLEQLRADLNDPSRDRTPQPDAPALVPRR